MEKLKDLKAPGSQQNSSSATVRSASRSSFSFLRLFSSTKSSDGVQVKEKTPSEKPFRETVKTPVSRGSVPRNTTGVRQWVGQEEKTVADYTRKSFFSFRKATTVPQAKPVTVPSKPQVSQQEPVSDAFVAQTVTLSPLPLSKPLGGIAKKEKSALTSIVSGMIVASLLTAAYFLISSGVHFSLPKAKEAPAVVPAQLFPTQTENRKLQIAYDDLQNTSTDQRNEIRRLQSELRNLTQELRSVRGREVTLTSKEKNYRTELMRITTQYEIQLDTLRQQVSGQDEIIIALKAQIKAFEKLLDESGLAGLTGIASHAAKTGQFFAAPRFDPVSGGKVILVNGRYRFIVINAGSQQGVRSAQSVGIFRNGVKITEGIIDRVYPTMSAITSLDREALSMVKEGDSVSFSN